MQTNLPEIYAEREQAFSAALSGIRRRIIFVSNIRLTVALAFLALVYFTFTLTWLICPAILLVMVFALLVRQHSKLFDEKTHLENLVRINQDEANALKGDYASFDSGRQFIDPHHPYTHDLDIFGDRSLFQYLNRCNTLSGKRKLADRLANYLKDQTDIKEHQAAIREISPRLDFRQHFQASGMEINEQPDDYAQLIQWVRQPDILKKSGIISSLLTIMPALTIIAVITAFFLPYVKGIAVLLVVANWIILGTELKKINIFHDYISRKKNILQQYAKLLNVLRGEKASSKLMDRVVASARDGSSKVIHLASLVNALDARLNFLMNIAVNSLLLYDLQCVYRLEKWKRANAAQLPEWIDAITEAELLCSFGNFSFNNSSYTYADVHEELVIGAKHLAHPLIDPDERIANDFSIGEDGRIHIITGANMAGKSTFLRTVGVNVVLALNGAPVCAEAFHCPLIDLRTGMRTADSLKDHQSYFFAELDRLKIIMDELRTGRPLLILLDEILKGTNSTDKQAGSFALLKQLLPHKCLAVIATHDLVLATLEDKYPQAIRNYSFEPNIVEEQLSFDYKLRTGVAQKMNATFLMRKMGIIPKD